MKVTLRTLAFGVVLVSLAGCENGVQNMYDQAKYKPQAASELWSDGRAARPMPAGTVAFSGGPLADASSGRAERREAEASGDVGANVGANVSASVGANVGARVEANVSAGGGAGPQPEIYSTAALARGRDRYGIFCTPCHGAAGDGDGYITRRGFPHPPTFHADRLRGAPDQYLFDVMSRGYGAMYPYADRITPQDRWAIVGYVRALQRSQHASLHDLPVTERNPPATGERQPGAQ
jgi:mono/diheme cytochrome c family protein